MNYPIESHADEFLGRKGDAVQIPRTAMHTLSVNPRHSMKAATTELEASLERLGADMGPATRRRTALLASELIAQVAGRDLGQTIGSVDLTVVFAPKGVRLETRGPSTPAVTNGFEPDPGDGLAEWGQFLLNRLADRWGIDGNHPPILWAEVDLA
jgi:hypothetical protein